MLLFSTILDINKKMTKDAFIKLVIEWNQGSPHANNVIPGIEWHGERNIRYGDDDLWLDIEEYRNENIIAVRYEKKESDGAIWDTDYVMNFNAMKMTVRLDRSYTEDALAYNPQFSTPHFIAMLIERGYIAPDGDQAVLKKPIVVTQSNLHHLADIINGNIRYRLPVVYVSKTYHDENPVNIGLMSSRLKGVAHVLLQEGTWLNSELKNLCDFQNEYYGAIGIYYPNASINHRRYLYHSEEGYDEVQMDKVIRAVIQYSNSQMIDTLYTWQGVDNALLRDRLDAQRQERHAAERARKVAEERVAQLINSRDEEEREMRAKALADAQAEASRLVESCDDELQQLRDAVTRLTRQNEQLDRENQSMRAKLDAADAVPLLYMGREQEFYDGEIKDLTLAALNDALGGTAIPKETRRASVVRDIVQSNNYEKLGVERANKVKQLMRDYNGMTAKLRQSLLDLGFTITEDGKHYKVRYHGDTRYQITLAKTPSDYHSGRNDAATLIQKSF